MKKMACLALASLLAVAAWGEDRITLRYAHVNTTDSLAGQMALDFAERVKEYSKDSIYVEVYPDSRLGGIQEMAEEVSSGVVAFHHTTAAALGSLFEDFGVLDTPYIYRDVAQLMKVADPSSLVMDRLSRGLSRARKVKVIGSFYFGTRQLTCDRPIRVPGDLAGIKLRAIPFPVYQTAVEGLGGLAVPIDWAQTPTALAARVVNGQENPVNIILSSRLYESQSYLMLTGHILSAGIIVANEAALGRLSVSQRLAVSRAASEACAAATKRQLDQEASDIASLKAKGMVVIGSADGLDLAAFRARTAKLVRERFGSKWGEYYRLIEETR